MISNFSLPIHRGFEIPKWIIWIQCIAFIVLYSVWILPEIVGFRNTALVVGAVFGLYPLIYFRGAFMKKSAIAIWCVIALFGWATFHLLLLSPNFPAQLIEYFRIWKYAALGAIMATGLGISLAQSSSNRFWCLIYIGLSAPLIIYFNKFLLTTIGVSHGLSISDSLIIHNLYTGGGSPNRFYVPKTDYVAFCLPIFSVALGLLIYLFRIQTRWLFKDRIALVLQVLVLAATLFLFSAQNIKNGMLYAFILLFIFSLSVIRQQAAKINLAKIFILLVIFGVFASAITFNVKKNNSWGTLIADTKIALQLERHPNWKDPQNLGYPLNEYGTTVSITNYERVAWAYAGIRLSMESPLGYGLIEDSFAKMTKARWPEASNSLSHSHSGWLDLILGIGYPGFFLILSAMLLCLKNAKVVRGPLGILIIWPTLANLFLWCTTEVAATVTFAALIFWVCLSCGVIMGFSMKNFIEHPQLEEI